MHIFNNKLPIIIIYFDGVNQQFFVKTTNSLMQSPSKLMSWELRCSSCCLKDGHTLVTLPRILTPYRDSVDETRACVTYQKLVTR